MEKKNPLSGSKNTRSIIEKLVITIDGPSGSGKSTTANELASRLNLKYLDTGAMYRAVTWMVLESGIDPEDSGEVSRVASRMELSLGEAGGETVMLLNGRSVEDKIRTAEVSQAVSPVSRHAGVRREMVKLQRRMGRRGGIVVEGRDTGSTVFPFAQAKVFLVADLDTRARRRYLQLKSMGIEQDMDEIRENLAYRDRVDSSREMSPLVRPPGSILVDTTGLTVNQQVERIKEEVRGVAEHIGSIRVGKYEQSEYSRMKTYYAFTRLMVYFFFKIIFGLEVRGLENLNFNENFLFASNHISYFDPPVVGSVLKRELNFVAKKELFRNRFFGWLISRHNAIPVDREEISRKTLRLLMKKLKGGNSILMFPEGTRSKDGKLGNMKPGLGFLALRAGITTIPIHVRGTDDLFGCLIRKRRLEVRIGPPIRIARGYRPENKRKDYRVFSRMVDDEIRMLRDE